VREEHRRRKAHRAGRTATAERLGAAGMNSLRSFKQQLSHVSRLWEKGDYDSALAEVESLRTAWPGNGHLHILWASLVQLQEKPDHSLEEAKQALQQAIALDRTSPAGPIELGHFLDAVEDDPQAASKSYSEGVAAARRLLVEGLIGQAKALLQLGKRKDALRCVREVLNLIPFQPVPKRGKADHAAPDIIFGVPTGGAVIVELKGPFAEQIEELLEEVSASRSA
jgi:tetratricopeptide (TPR) repeat protein